MAAQHAGSSGFEAQNLRLSLRPVRAQDEPFLRRVYASTREEELARLPWRAAEKEEFLEMQFRAQDRAYRSDYPGAELQIVLVNGEPAGRLYVWRIKKEIRIMDLALLAPFRRKGIGTRLLKEILCEGQESARAVTIHVEVFNPAQRLYQRLGFRPVADNGVYRLMEWRAAGQSSP